MENNDKIQEPIKQIIVMRTDLEMGRGKMVGQGGHSVIAFALEILKEHGLLSELQEQWILQGQKKIALKVGSEKELLDIFSQAQDLGLTPRMVTDMGLTQLKGQNRTCLSIDPTFESKLEPIKKDLKLL